VLQSSIDWSNAINPSLGLFVDRGQAEICDLAAYKLG
jgi:hypothetical protein